MADTIDRSDWYARVKKDPAMTMSTLVIAEWLSQNASQGYCPIGLATIASATGTSQRTTRRAFNMLKARGWLTIHRDAGRPNAYDLRMP